MSLDKLKVNDPDGERWHREAKAELVRANKPRARRELKLPDLPKWKAPAHVKRELLGRFLQDRDSAIVHDVQAAKEECGVDLIRNGTFFHFWSEVVAHELPDVPCPYCLPQ